MAKQPTSRFYDENINPCVEESKLSMKCLEDKFYDHSKCQNFFENYKTCKKFWKNLSRRRKFAGISPDIPTKEERDKILKLREKGINVISAQD